MAWNFFFFFSSSSTAWILVMLLWTVIFPYHMEENVRLFHHITGPRKLHADLLLRKQVATQPSKSMILESIFFAMFKHILNFQDELKPYWCQWDKNMSPHTFLNVCFISANFIIVNAFPRMGQFFCWRFSWFLLIQTTKLHKENNFYKAVNGSDSQRR